MAGIAPLGQPLGQAPGAHARSQCRRDSLCPSRQPARQHGSDDHHVEDDGRKRGQPEDFAAVQHRHAQGCQPCQQDIGQAEPEQAAALRQGLRGKRGRQKSQQLRRRQHAQQDKPAQHQHEAPEQAGGHSGQQILLPVRGIAPYKPGRERHGQGSFAQQPAQQMRQTQGRHQGIGHRPAAHQPGHAHVAHQPQQAGKQGEQGQHPCRAGHAGTALLTASSANIGSKITASYFSHQKGQCSFYFLLYGVHIEFEIQHLQTIPLDGASRFGERL